MWKSLFRIFRRFSRDRENRSNPWVRSGKAPHRGRGREKKKQEENEESSRSKQTRKLLRRSVFLLCACVCVRLCEKEAKKKPTRKRRSKRKQQQLEAEAAVQRKKKQSAAYFGFRTVFDSQSTSPRGTVNFVFCYLLTPRSRTRRSIHQCQPCQIR